MATWILGVPRKTIVDWLEKSLGNIAFGRASEIIKVERVQLEYWPKAYGSLAMQSRRPSQDACRLLIVVFGPGSREAVQNCRRLQFRRSREITQKMNRTLIAVTVVAAALSASSTLMDGIREFRSNNENAVSVWGVNQFSGAMVFCSVFAVGSNDYLNGFGVVLL